MTISWSLLWLIKTVVLSYYHKISILWSTTPIGIWTQRSRDSPRKNPGLGPLARHGTWSRAAPDLVSWWGVLNAGKGWLAGGCWGQSMNIAHDGSVCIVYMLTWMGYIDGKWQTIYGIHTDPMGYANCGSWHRIFFDLFGTSKFGRSW